MYFKNGNKSSDQFTMSPSKYPQKRFFRKNCRWCNEEFQPRGPSHLYCSDECADKGHDDKWLIKTYGITRKDYQAMIESQNYQCKICDGEGFLMRESHKSKLVIDHDHETGEVRGLLCHNCNRGLGLFKDSAKNLKKAQDYLEGATTSRKT